MTTSPAALASRASARRVDVRVTITRATRGRLASRRTTRTIPHRNGKREETTMAKRKPIAKDYCPSCNAVIEPANGEPWTPNKECDGCGVELCSRECRETHQEACLGVR